MKRDNEIFRIFFDFFLQCILAKNLHTNFKITLNFKTRKHGCMFLFGTNMSLFLQIFIAHGPEGKFTFAQTVHFVIY